MKRDYSLDVLKIVGTILIIFHHYQQITGAVFSRINFWNGTFTFGYLVEMFFLISGFLMLNYISKIENGLSFKDFFVRRWLRFAPTVTFAAVSEQVFIIFYKKLYGESFFGLEPSLGGSIVASLCIQEGWGFPNPRINNPVWYISVLLLCYVIFYFLVYIAKRRGYSLCYLFIGMIFLGIWVTNTGNNFLFINLQSARGLYTFFFGCLFAMLLRRHPVKNAVLMVSVPVCIIMVYLIQYHAASMVYGFPFLLTYVLYPAIIISLKAPCMSKLFSHRWIGELSKISFSVFVWHCPMFSLMYDVRSFLHWYSGLNSVRAMICFALVCFAVGTCSHYLFENPINRLIDKRLLNKQKTQNEQRAEG